MPTTDPWGEACGNSEVQKNSCQGLIREMMQRLRLAMAHSLPDLGHLKDLKAPKPGLIHQPWVCFFEQEFLRPHTLACILRHERRGCRTGGTEPVRKDVLAVVSGIFFFRTVRSS